MRMEITQIAIHNRDTFTLETLEIEYENKGSIMSPLGSWESMW